MAAAASLTIPSFYRIWFSWIDPIAAAPMVYMSIFKRLDAMAIANPMSSGYDTAYDPLMWQLTGFYGMVVILCTVLLRYTSDVGVWKILSGGILFVDLSILAGTYEMLATQGRLSPGLLTSMDWSNVLFTSFVALVRAAFILDVGFGTSTTSVKKTR